MKYVGPVSRLAAAWAAEGTPAPWRELHGSAVLTDLSGFTRLTEQLMGRGAEGVEVLHRVLALCFGSLLERSLDLGGDVIGFAGDAALVWFDGDDHQFRALEAASAMPRDLAELPAVMTGGKRLRVSVGVHTGRFLGVLAGTSQQGLFLCGPATSHLVALQTAAQPGQVLMSDDIAANAPAAWRGARVPPGVVLTRRTPKRPPAPTAIPVVPPTPTTTPTTTTTTTTTTIPVGSSLLGPGVRELYESGVTASQHRIVTVGFVKVAGTDATLAHGGPDALHQRLHRMASAVSSATVDLGLEWIDTDVGVDCVKILIAAGAPRSVGDDEERMLVALRRILDDGGERLQAATQRGPVFSGPMGVSRRSTYTVLGDPVNVAARALGFATDGDIIAADGLGVAHRISLRAESLGSRALRNRARPVGMWRVVRVGSFAPVPKLVDETIAGSSRREEWRHLASAWKRTVDGSGSAHCIIGEPGMGASELAREVADLAGAGATTLVADPFERHAPLSAISRLVESIALASGDRLPAGPWLWLRSFTQELPEDLRPWAADVLDRVVTPGAAPDDDPRTVAARSTVVLSRLLMAAAPSPWLLAVHEADRIDDASLTVIAHLASSSSELPVMVVATGGAEFRITGAEVMALDPLCEAEAIAMVHEVAPTRRDDEVTRIVTAAAGNPFVLVELARHDPGGNDLPDSLQRLGTILVDELPPSVRSLVRDASAFGTVVSLALGADVLGQPELADPRSWWAARPLLRDEHDGTLTFVHEVYRTAAHDSLPFARRRQLHGAIADRLAVAETTPDAVLATHLLLANRDGEALPVTVAAARGAAASGALVEAAALLADAVGLARRTSSPLLEQLLVESGEVLGWIGDHDAAGRALGAANRCVTDPVLRARLCHLLADHAIDLGRHRAARRWVEHGLALTVALPSETRTERIRLLLDLAAIALDRGRHERSIEIAGEALQLADGEGSRVLTGLCHLHLQMAHDVVMDDAAVSHGDAAIRAFEAEGHDRYLTSALINTGLTAKGLGRYDDAIERYERAAVLARRWAWSHALAAVSLNLGFIHLRQCDLGAAEACARRAMRTFETEGAESASATARVLLSQIATTEGRLEVADALLTEARTVFERLGDTGMVADCDVMRMERLVGVGRYDDAILSADRTTRSLPSASTAVTIAFERTLGMAESLVGAANGPVRMRAALDLARARRLVDSEYLCLAALLAVEGEGGPAAPPRTAAARNAIARQLGIRS